MVSFPHFFEADSSYLENINGLHPNRERHRTTFLIEPVSFDGTFFQRLIYFPRKKETIN